MAISCTDEERERLRSVKYQLLQKGLGLKFDLYYLHTNLNSSLRSLLPHPCLYPDRSAGWTVRPVLV